MRNTFKNAAPNAATLLGVPAVVGLTVLGGLGLQLGSPSSAPARIPVAEVATSMVPLDHLTPAQEQLLTKLPSGYGHDACKPVTDTAPGVVAAVDCTDNAHGGPKTTRYIQHTDLKALNNDFPTEPQAGEPMKYTPCPGGVASPGSWHNNNTPNVVAGKVACGTYNDGETGMQWTKDSDLLHGLARGGDLNAVYQWWTQYR